MTRDELKAVGILCLTTGAIVVGTIFKRPIPQFQKPTKQEQTLGDILNGRTTVVDPPDYGRDPGPPLRPELVGKRHS